MLNSSLLVVNMVRNSAAIIRLRMFKIKILFLRNSCKVLRMLRAEDERMWVAEFYPLLHSPAPDGIFDSRRCSSVLKPKG